MSRDGPPVTLISFDVEEFDAPIDFGRAISEEEQSERGAEGWRRALDLLDELDVGATLFITAWMAQQHPTLLQRSAARHEIASHGFRHGSLEPGDLARSREALKHASGQRVLGFRRARLQATDPGEILAAGYAWDSSENPIWLPGRYNNLRAPRTLHRRGDLVELPISASPLLRLPLFWLAMKNLPMPLIRAASARCLRRDGYLNLYWHPWELLDLRRSGLPRVARRIDGPRMADRLRRYIAWLRERSRMQTISSWLLERGAIRGA